MFSRFDRTPACGTETDGQAQGHGNTAYAVLAYRRAVRIGEKGLPDNMMKWTSRVFFFTDRIARRANAGIHIIQRWILGFFSVRDNTLYPRG